MSKGHQARFDAKTETVRTRAKAPKSGSQGGSKVSIKSEARCWEFSLTNVTEQGHRAKRGLTVHGAISAGRVLVLSNNGTLGFAPQREAQRMIAAIDGTDRTLTGEVTAAQEKDGTIRAKLCL